MPTHTPAPSPNSVVFTIGTPDLVESLFPYCPKTLVLSDFIAHLINQTLQRDLCYGAWAQVTAPSSTNQLTEYQVKITTPDGKTRVDHYEDILKGFLAAAASGVNLYNSAMKRFSKPPTGISFLSPIGLAMGNVRSVQLLHYPPTETLNYIDYLYSPTNRRWENLLGYNGHPGEHNTLVETIVDLVPVAADGGKTGGQQIALFKETFQPYVEQLLKVYARPTKSGKATIPVVAYGGPVMDYLQKVYKPKDLSRKLTGYKTGYLQALSLVSLKLAGNKTPTPVLCANHPAQFMYAKPEQKDHFMTILKQDLIAAGWQSAMSRKPDADPLATLTKFYNHWMSPRKAKLLEQIYAEQTTEF